MRTFRRLAVSVLLFATLAAQAFAGNVFVLPGNTFDTSVAVFTDDPFQSSTTVTVPSGVLNVLAKPDGTKYYIVSASKTDSIIVMNGTLTSVLRRIDLDPAPRAAGLSPDGKRLIVLAGNGLRVFDTASANDNEVTLSGSTDVGLSPFDLAFSLDSRWAYILSSQSAILTQFGLENDHVAGAVEVPGGTGGVAVSPQGVVYVSGTNRLYEIDPKSLEIRREIPLNGSPGKPAITPNGRYALMANSAAFLATGLGFLVDLESLEVSSIPRTGNSPEVLLSQLAAADDTTFFGLSSSTKQVVKITVGPLTLHTSGFLLSSKTDVRGVAVSREQPDAEFLYVTTGSGVSRGRISNSDVVDRSVTPTPGRIALASGASIAVPNGGSRKFGDLQTVVAGSTTQPLILQVWDSFGLPTYNKTVTFSTTTPGVTFDPASAQTSSDGFVQTRVTVPESSGVITVNAAVEGLSSPITFAITVAGGVIQPSDTGLLMYSGNGQVVPRGFPTEQPLRVRLTNAAGDPIVGGTVSWAIASGEGAVWPQESETDVNGIAEADFSGTVLVPPSTSFVQSTVTATVAGFNPVTFTMTTVPQVLGTGAPARPQYNLLAPTSASRLVGQAGQTVAAAVKLTVRALTGIQSGSPIPNVGVALSSTGDPATTPSATCAGEGNTPLSDATGTITCNVVFGPVIGGPVPIRIIAGGGGQFSAGAEFSTFLTVTAGPPGQITILDGNNQSGAPGALLPIQLSAKISDAFGNILANTPVTWEPVTSGTATIVTSSATTDSQGKVSAQVRLGNTGGQVQIRLRAGAEEAVFNLFVNIPVSTLVLVSGDAQNAIVNTAFASPLVVEARNAQGQPVSGAAVNFSVVSGPATLGSASATTGSNGRAQTTVTAGSTTGPVVIRATTATFSVTFNLNVGIPVATLTKISGDGQTAIVNQDFGSPLVVELRDQQGAVVSGAAVTFAVVSGPATVGSATASSGTNGRASTTVRAGATAGAVVIQASSFTFNATFNLSVVPPGPVILRQNVRNAVNGDMGVTPGGVIAIYGQGIAPGIQGSVVANGGYLLGPLPTLLAGVEVTFGSVKAPIYHVNNLNGQEFVVVQAPFTLTAGTPTPVTVKVGSGSTTIEGVEVKAYQPGFFETLGPSGQRWAMVSKENGTFVTAENPIRRGVDTKVRIYCGGLGQANPALATNAVGVPGQTVLAQLTPYILTTDGSSARVLSAEPMQGVVGVYVVTLELPPALQTGADKLLILGVSGPNGAFTYTGNTTIANIE